MKTSIFPCPNCGEAVPGNAKACPHCGSDENTGWSKNTCLDGLDLYDDGDYRETLRREFGIRFKGARRRDILIGFVAVVILLLFFLYYILPSL
jgi:uncharacterized membrane protein YvbJ